MGGHYENVSNGEKLKKIRDKQNLNSDQQQHPSFGVFKPL